MEFDEAVKKVSEVFRIECFTDFQNKVLKNHGEEGWCLY